MAKRIAPDAARPMELVDGQAPKRVAKHDEDKWDPFLLSEFRRQAVDYRNTYPTHSMKLLIQNVKERLKADKTTKEEKAAIDNLKITANMLKRVAPDYAAPRPDPNKQAKKAATPKGGAKLIAALTDTVKENIQDAVTDFRKKNPYAPIKALVEHVNKTVRKDNGESYVFKSPTLRKLINNEAVYQPKKKVGIDVLDDAVKQKIREKAKEFRDQNPYSPIREMAEYVNNHVTDTDGKHYGMNAQRLKEILGDEGLSIYRPQPKPRRERKRSRSGPSRPVDLPEDVQNKVRDLAKSYRESNPYASPEDLRKYVNENLHMNKEDGTPYDIGFVTLENIVDDDNVFYARRKPREGSTPTSSRKKNTTSNVNVYSDETYEKIINATEQALKDIGQDPSSQGLARYIRKEGDKAKRYITTYVNKKLGTTNIPLPQIIYANIQFNMTTDSRAVEVSNFMREWQREEEKNMKSKHSVSPEERRRRRLLNLYKYAWKYAYEKAPQTSFVDAIPALDYILTQNPPELHGKPVMVDELNEALRTDWTRKEKSEINAFLAPSKEARKQRDKVERERKKEENAKKKEAEKERKRLEKENQKRAAERAEAAEKLKQAQEKIRELESRKMTFTPMTEAQIANAAQAGQSIDAVKGMDWLGERIATNSNNRINEKIAEQQKIIEDIYKRFSELKPPRTGGYTQQTPRKFAPLFTLPIPEKPRRFVKVYKK